MNEEMHTIRAEEVYQTLCSFLDRQGWTYEKHRKNFAVSLGINYKDIGIKCLFVIDAKRQVIRFMSPMDFKMSENKRIDGAIATCLISNKLFIGNFDYNFSEGDIVFRMTEFFIKNDIGEGLFDEMIDRSCTIISAFYHDFLAISKGEMELDEFIQQYQ